jgi:hypothetical protein
MTLRTRIAAKECGERELGVAEDGQGPICFVAPYGDICQLDDFLTPKFHLGVQNQRKMRLKWVYNVYKAFSTCEKGLYSSIAVQVRISLTLK